LDYRPNKKKYTFDYWISNLISSSVNYMARKMARTMVIMATKAVITSLNKYKLQNLRTALKEKT